MAAIRLPKADFIPFSAGGSVAETAQRPVR